MIRRHKHADVSKVDTEFYRDLLLKHTAQAFAEASKGDVYLVIRDAETPDDRIWPTDRTWGGT